MTTSYNSAGHKESPHKYDFEDVDDAPLPARKAKPNAVTTDEVFDLLCRKQHVNPDYITDARFRSLVNISELATAKINALYAYKLTARIEAVYAYTGELREMTEHKAAADAEIVRLDGKLIDMTDQRDAARADAVRLALEMEAKS